MKKILYFLILLVIATLIGVVLLNYTQSDLSQEEILKLTEEDLYNYMIDNYTPIGSKKDEVLEFIHNVGYKIRHDINFPFSDREKPYTEYGNNQIRVYLGEYTELFTDRQGDSLDISCSVIVFWVFDDDELVHINVWKVWDGT